MGTSFMSTVALHPFSDAVVVMGVASCGKTTIGEALAAELGLPFIEGDKLHPLANVEKMSAGQPLNDHDRWPWLAQVGKALRGTEGRIASCSALKKSYRECIAKHAERPVVFIHLHGSIDVLRNRIAARTGHFMPPALLDSQLATLEMPEAGEAAITIDIDQSPQFVLREALDFLTSERKS
jgi:carbohydrate kinase (thermoresistant glucokinase family)